MNPSGNQRRTFMSTRVCMVMGEMLIDPRRFGTPTCSPVWSQLTAWKLSSVPVANAQVGSSRSRLTCGVKGERERMAGSTSAAPTGVGWEADSQSLRQHQVLANSSGIVPRHKSQGYRILPSALEQRSNANGLSRASLHWPKHRSLRPHPQPVHQSPHRHQYRRWTCSAAAQNEGRSGCSA